MTKISKADYLSKVKLLTKEETERLLSRMGGKLDRRLEKNKITQAEALAMQLELEDEQLKEWRKVMLSLKEKENEKAKKIAKKEKDKVAKITKAVIKSKAPSKSKTPSKAKDTVKPKAPKKANAKVKAKVTEQAKVESGK